MSDSAPKHPRPGDFPFPITQGSEEAPNLVWLRNHSNYMTGGGMLDYLRAVGVLLRGILINSLIFLPYLLAIAILLSIAMLVDPLPRFLLLPSPPFMLTKFILGLFVLWILVFSLGTPILRIARFRKSRATGSTTTVNQRNRYEHSFGYFLLAIFALGAVESLPGLLLLYHREYEWTIPLGSLALFAPAIVVVPKLISMLGGGLLRHLALVIFGALGLIIPLLFVLFVSDFLVFELPADLTLWTLFAVLPVAAMFVIGLVIGVRQRAFHWRDARLIALFAALSVGFVAFAFQSDRVALEWFDHQKKPLETRALTELTKNKEDRRILGEHLTRFPSPKFKKIHARMNQPVPKRSENREFTGIFEDLVESGEKAGLNPEMERIISEIASSADCSIDALQKTRCRDRDLEDELRRLRTNVKMVPAFRSIKGTHAELTELLVLSSEEELSGMRNPVSSFPRIRKLLDPNMAAMANASKPGQPDLSIDGETCPGRPAATPTPTQAIDDFHTIHRILCEIAIKIEKAKYELASVASVKLPDSRFYASDEARAIRDNAFKGKALFIFIVAVQLFFFCWLTVDVNLTSVHGLYRDRLATAFLVGDESETDRMANADVDLMEICDYEAGSIAPYHLINVALNLQGSQLMEVRDRRSDFFIFSKRFIGGLRTGYCKSETMEHFFPQMDLGTAMAISAAAASPNMGRATNPMLVAIMTMLNLRMGFWLPNPGLLESGRMKVESTTDDNEGPLGISFDEVVREEQKELLARWNRLEGESNREFAADSMGSPSLAHKLAGIGFSGGGIRSATVNLGLAQALDAAGAFPHFDYLSTVSGGGYLGSSLSASMRQRPTETGTPASKPSPSHSPPTLPGEELSMMDVLRWRVRPSALLREVLGKLDEKRRWVNVSDGGHIENLAAIELLRRRCRYILIGDAEADPEHQFQGLSTLVRTARIDLGVDIDINVDALRLSKEGLSERHWAIGRIRYPADDESPEPADYGYLLYTKSSITGREDVVIKQYREASPTFPHESTADQFFTEGQFEAYRSLGQHIGEEILGYAPELGQEPMGFKAFEKWFETLYQKRTEIDETRRPL